MEAKPGLGKQVGEFVYPEEKILLPPREIASKTGTGSSSGANRSSKKDNPAYIFAEVSTNNFVIARKSTDVALNNRIAAAKENKKMPLRRQIASPGGMLSVFEAMLSVFIAISDGKIRMPG